MGFFAKQLQAFGGAPAEDLLTAGLLGCGVIVGVRPTGVSMTTGAGEGQVHLFTVEVTLDDVASYTAECRQLFAPATLSQLVAGEPTVAVRVDPQDRARI